MKKLTTIKELIELHGLSDNQIRILFNKNGIKPISTEDIYVNRIKQPRSYLLSDVEPVIVEYLNGNEKPKEKFRSYTHEFICKILRPHCINSLSGKLISSWTYSDWIQFEKLKNEKLKSIQVNY